MKPKCFSYTRFSRPEQAEGDTLRRQDSMAFEYAEKHGLVLDKSLNMSDHGLSAYSGDNKKKGALGSFLKLIKDGKIAKGSVLLIEHVDRLSREPFNDAHVQFNSILESGVDIVTLSDSQHFNRQSINDIGSVIPTLIKMDLSHQESEKKSQRLKAAWQNKRDNVSTKKLTSRGPAWLELSDDRSEFIAVEERAKVINTIFDMKLQGKGSQLIARTLNQDSELWKPSTKWRKSYIGKILRNRACIGEFQPMRRIEGVRQPVDQPVKDYFPTVVQEETFLKVQALIKNNKFYGGRNGAISNLFSHLMRCGYCQGPMRLIDKGKGRKKLICDNAVRGIGCERLQIHYKNFEDIILDFCVGLKVSDLIKDDQHLIELEQLKDKVLLIDDRLKTIEKEEAFFIKRMKKTLDDRIADDYEKGISALKDEKEILKEDRSKAQTEIEKLSVLDADIKLRLSDIKDLKEIMKNLKGDELRDIRLRLRDKIRDLIDSIDIFAKGDPKETENLIEDMKGIYTEDELKDELKGDPNYVISFKSGVIRSLFPYKDKKLSWQLDKTKKQLDIY